MFVISKFKPFVKLSWEYLKIRSEGVQNKCIRFPIPQLRDFINDICAKIKIRAQSSLQKIPERSKNRINPNQKNKEIPRDGFDWDNVTPKQVVYTITAFDEIQKSKYRNLVKLRDFPGERILKNVKFFASNNLIEEYDCSTSQFLRENIPEDKITGYKRMQESVEKLYINSEIITPLNFWFCKDVAYSFPITAIPGSRFIEIEVAKLEDIIEENSIVSINQFELTDFPKEAEKTPLLINGKIRGDIKIELYAKNIFITQDIQILLFSRIRKSIIKTTKMFHKQASENVVFINNVVQPVEYLLIKFGKNKFTLENKEESYVVDIPIIQKMHIYARGIKFYDGSPIFYQHVMNRHFRSSELYKIDFRQSSECISGHLNFGKIRDFNIEYDSEIRGLDISIYFSCINI